MRDLAAALALLVASTLAADAAGLHDVRVVASVGAVVLMAMASAAVLVVAGRGPR